MERSQVDRAPVVLTTTPLAASATAYYPSKNGESRTGSTFLVAYVRALAWSDQAGSLILEESDDDAVTWAQTGSTVTVSASTIATFAQTALTKKSWRWKYINGGTIQTKFNLLEDREPASANVKVTDALPAGTANIGDVDVLSIAAGDNNIGNVDIASIAAGTNNIGDVDVASIAAGANIIGKVGIDQTTPGTTNGVQVNAALPAGTNNIGDVDIASAIPAGANVIGKVSIDQTTPGTTNLVDTELPAAAALADAAANPTTPTVGAALKVWNGTTWDNADGVNTGQLVTTPKGSAGSEVIGATGAAVPAGAVAMGASDGTNLDMLRAIDSVAADGITAPTSGNLSVAAMMFGDNGTTKDRWRNNTKTTALVSATRTTTTTSATQRNYNSRGALAVLRVTAASGTGGLQLQFETPDPVSGNVGGLTALPAAIIATGIYIYELGPGASGGATGDVIARTAGELPTDYDIRVVHGDASNYTYSVAVFHVV